MELVFIPFVSLGEYKFGCSETAFLEHTDVSYIDNAGANGKKMYEYKNMMFRFDNATLTQVAVDNLHFTSSIIFNGVNINTLDMIKQLIVKYKAKESRSHFILSEIGVAITKNIAKLRDVELYIFDRQLLPFWENIHRPITSW